MARIEGMAGQENAFKGGDDSLYIPLATILGRNGSRAKTGFQISADGFEISEAVVEVWPDGAGEAVLVDAPEGAGSAATYGEGFYLSAVEISGLAAGDYKVTIIC